MNNFIKTVLSLVFTILVFSSCSKNDIKTSILLEPESFDIKGGWVVDAQFVEQMGSPYLMAHGMGKPVENAITTLPSGLKGKYHIWVRTKNWAPGNWDAPGRFKIKIGKELLDTTFGIYSGWGWQYGGQIKIKGDKKLELVDLTGFNGRIDAIFITNDSVKPPNDLFELSKWRMNMHGESEFPQKDLEYDFVVVGGGIAGCAASIAAAKKGLKVALIHDRPVLGGNASSEVRVHTLGIKWKYQGILDKIDTKHYPNGSKEAIIDQEKRDKEVKAFKNIDLFTSFRAYSVTNNESGIESVLAKNIETGERISFSAPFFADCTGDGWIGYWAGADYMYGRESKSTFGEGIDVLPENFHADFLKDSLFSSWDTYKDLWSPVNADNRVMGTSLLWQTVVDSIDSDFPDVPWAEDVVSGHGAINGEWYWEYSKNELNQIEDGEEIRDHMLKAIYGSFANAKKLEENKNIKLEWVSYISGKRESRRLVGDYIYTMKDAVSQTKFKDAVAKEKRAIDVHYQRNLIQNNTSDFLSDAMFYNVGEYYIPYRTLYSVNVENLFMAGRNFSCSHVGLGGPRVMNTTGQMGAAVGFAAFVATKNNTTPRGVYKDHLDELLEIIDNQ